MNCTTELIDYADTGYFSSLVVDYLHEDPKLQPFYQYSPVNPDFEKIMEARKAFPTDRKLLVNELDAAYRGMETDKAVTDNIALLSGENTFTICTAHQPNLFTGYLYFVYKIIHAIKLADYLKGKYVSCHFVPVYYMGSEDNDLEELGTVHLYGEKYQWNTAQSGAVGRMRPEGLDSMIQTISEELGNNEFAMEIMDLVKKAYLEHPDIQTATFYLVNALFGRFGLVVINADTPGFKRAFLPVMREELLEQSSFPIVKMTGEKLVKHYHAQATPREINLFYLNHQMRERIVKEGDQWRVLNTAIIFNKEQLEQEITDHPERFSPNVILRGLLQESILPDIAFIGGGGELSYWMELKDLFAHYRAPFPLLMLRNSVLWVDDKYIKRLKKVDLEPKDLFQNTELMINEFVKKSTREALVLKEEYGEIDALFEELGKKAANIDVTLKASVGAEHKKALQAIGKLEHKFLRAEKKKFVWQTDLIRNVKNHLFPHNGLQERVENLLPFYATYGRAFIDTLYDRLDPMNKGFTIIEVQ